MLCDVEALVNTRHLSSACAMNIAPTDKRNCRMP
jgi:hypothetical protein